VRLTLQTTFVRETADVAVKFGTSQRCGGAGDEMPYSAAAGSGKRSARFGDYVGLPDKPWSR
jgi:hypothetical protein